MNYKDYIIIALLLGWFVFALVSSKKNKCSGCCEKCGKCGCDDDTTRH